MTQRKPPARKRLPKPLTLILDDKLIAMLKALDHMERELEAQRTARGKKKWTIIQLHSVLGFIENEGKPKIAAHLKALFDAQYPRKLYVR